MKIGTEDKKKTILAVGLTLVALGTVYVQFFTGDAGSTTPRAVASTQPKSALSPQARPSRNVGAGAAPAAAVSTGGRRRVVRVGNAFEPIWRRSHDDDAFDPLNEDPTLATSRLAAVRGVSFGGVERNIFRFGERKKAVAPPPDSTIAEAQKRQQEFAARAKAQNPQPTAAPAEQPRRAPRLTWKYYGYAAPSGDGERRAFLLDGEDVLIGSEGSILKNRYKLVRIGLTNVVIEDMQFKEEQSLAITAPKG
ncbi:MAG: hypothetical protein GC160_26020 [Acidobacteria bacterium]|nr:hypothetical protein [Acidobacteriota bacterium]